MKILIVLMVLHNMTVAVISQDYIVRDFSIDNEEFSDDMLMTYDMGRPYYTFTFSNISGSLDDRILSPTKETVDIPGMPPVVANITLLEILKSEIDSVSGLCFSTQLRGIAILDNRKFPKLDEDILKNCENIKILNVSRIDLNDNAFQHMHNLVGLIMNHMEIDVLSQDLLEPLTNLRYLTIAYSNILHVEPGALCSSPNLRGLVLGHNKLPNLSIDMMSNCNYLELLDLSNFRNKNWRMDVDALNTMSNLDTLQVTGVIFPRLRKEYFRALSALRSLYLDGNNIEELDEDAFVHLTNLEMMFINHSSISNVKPATFHPLKKLEHLTLRHNELPNIDNVNGMPSLKTLDISYNDISYIDTRKLKKDFPNLDLLITYGNNMTCDTKSQLAIEMKSTSCYVFFRNRDCA